MATSASGSQGKKVDMEPMKNNLLAKQKQLEEAGLFDASFILQKKEKKTKKKTMKEEKKFYKLQLKHFEIFPHLLVYTWKQIYVRMHEKYSMTRLGLGRSPFGPAFACVWVQLWHPGPSGPG